MEELSTKVDSNVYLEYRKIFGDIRSANLQQKSTSHTTNQASLSATSTKANVKTVNDIKELTEAEIRGPSRGMDTVRGEYY